MTPLTSYCDGSGLHRWLTNPPDPQTEVDAPCPGCPACEEPEDPPFESVPLELYGDEQ